MYWVYFIVCFASAVLSQEMSYPQSFYTHPILNIPEYHFNVPQGNTNLNTEPKSPFETVSTNQEATKCETSGVLLRILNDLLKTLTYDLNTNETPTIEKVNKVLDLVKKYLEETPTNLQNELYNKFKALEVQLVKEKEQEPFTEKRIERTEIKEKTMDKIDGNILPYELPDLRKTNCKEAFSKLVKIAYNAYMQLVNHPICKDATVLLQNEHGILSQNAYYGIQNPYTYDSKHRNYRIFNPNPYQGELTRLYSNLNFPYAKMPQYLPHQQLITNPVDVLINSQSLRPQLQKQSPMYLTNRPLLDSRKPIPENNNFHIAQTNNLNQNVPSSIPSANPNISNLLVDNSVLPLNQSLNNNDSSNFVHSNNLNLPQNILMSLSNNPDNNSLLNPVVNDLNYGKYSNALENFGQTNKNAQPLDYTHLKPHRHEILGMNYQNQRENLQNKVPNTPNSALNPDKYPDQYLSNSDLLDQYIQMLIHGNNPSLPNLQLNLNNSDQGLIRQGSIGNVHPGQSIPNPKTSERVLTNEYKHFKTLNPFYYPQNPNLLNEGLVNQQSPDISNFSGQNPNKFVLNNLLKDSTQINQQLNPYNDKNLYHQFSGNLDHLQRGSSNLYFSSSPYNQQLNLGLVTPKTIDSGINYDQQVNYAVGDKPDSKRWPDVTNLHKLNPESDKDGIIELTYLLKRHREPIVYQPYYVVKYRLPYTEFLTHSKELLTKYPYLRSDPMKLYQELLPRSNATEVSEDLKDYNKDALKTLVARDGAFVKAKIVNANDTFLDQQLKIVQDLNSNVKFEDVINTLNEMINKTDSRFEIHKSTVNVTNSNDLAQKETAAEDNKNSLLLVPNPTYPIKYIPSNRLHRRLPKPANSSMYPSVPEKTPT